MIDDDDDDVLKNYSAQAQTLYLLTPQTIKVTLCRREWSDIVQSIIQ